MASPHTTTGVIALDNVHHVFTVAPATRPDFAATGNYTITVTIFDVGGASATRSDTASIVVAAVETDPNSGSSYLAVGGTTGNDSFTFSQSADGGLNVTAPGLNPATIDFASVARTMVYGGGGTDSVTMNGTSNADHFYLKSTSIVYSSAATGTAGGEIDLNGIQSMVVNGLGGNDTFEIQSEDLPRDIDRGNRQRQLRS